MWCSGGGGGGGGAWVPCNCARCGGNGCTGRMARHRRTYGRSSTSCQGQRGERPACCCAKGRRNDRPGCRCCYTDQNGFANMIDPAGLQFRLRGPRCCRSGSTGCCERTRARHQPALPQLLPLLNGASDPDGPWRHFGGQKHPAAAGPSEQCPSATLQTETLHGCCSTVGAAFVSISFHNVLLMAGVEALCLGLTGLVDLRPPRARVCPPARCTRRAHAARTPRPTRPACTTETPAPSP